MKIILNNADHLKGSNDKNRYECDLLDKGEQVEGNKYNKSRGAKRSRYEERERERTVIETCVTT